MQTNLCDRKKVNKCLGRSRGRTTLQRGTRKFWRMEMCVVLTVVWFRGCICILEVIKSSSIKSCSLFYFNYISKSWEVFLN